MTASPPPSPAAQDTARWRNGVGLAAFALAALALATPLLRAEPQGRLGLLLVLTALLEMLHALRRRTAAGQRSAWLGGVITLGMGVLLVNAPYFATQALVVILAGWFGLGGARYLIGAAWYHDERRSRLVRATFGVGYLLVAALLLVLRDEAAQGWVVAVACATHIFATASSIVLAPVFTAGDSGATVIERLGLSDHPEVKEMGRRVAEEEQARAAIDRGWVVGFLATLFAIHIARMGFDRTFLGVIAPGVAVLGDVFLALLLAFVVVIPGTVLWRWLTAGVERRAWAWCVKVPAGQYGWGRRAARRVLDYRLRSAIRLAQARYSLQSALSRGMQIGLPLAAIIAATVPVWGISWYFDTENWAAGMWNSWAAERTDDWREAMVAAVLEEEQARGPAGAFAVVPPEVSNGDFSFLVIGDPGEGDLSQHSLRARYLEVVRRPEVRFVVVSSDVVYPTGAMRDYEAKFWLPFMGTTKPVYAIPGNHDWYDALEGFTATFLEPAAARAAMRARVEVDGRITSTTDARIEELIATATRLRGHYGVPTQQQRGPFFQMQTASFALFAVDTGVVRRAGPAQLGWLRAGLEAARGKTKMVILGHPLYAGGHYTAGPGEDLAALHELLREQGVAVVMAGDTHDLEYYREERVGAEAMHHFVNGGGGAYLSFGTALDWPARPATAQWAFHPTRQQVEAKIAGTIPRWKRPAWWWTSRFGAWPFSVEWLSAAFDSNVAPFYQSFVEVRVEPSKGRVRLVPHGVRGELCWGDVEASPALRPARATADTPVEWVVKMAGR